jgi:hypothetical protein
MTTHRASAAVAPRVTTTQANGVIGGPQGPAAYLGRQRTPVRSRLDTLGLARQPP